MITTRRVPPARLAGRVLRRVHGHRLLVVALSVVSGLAAAADRAFAQDVRAFVRPADVALNRQFVLNVEVTGPQQLDAEPALPDLSDFAVYLGSGRSTSMQIVNGRTTVSLTIQYQYQAIAEGRFEIGPVTVPIGGQELRTEPLTVRISDTPAPAPGARRSGGAEVVAPEDLFVTATLGKPRVYVHEPVIVEYRLFTRVEVEGYAVTRRPTTTGFWVEELEPPGGVERVVRDGAEFATTVVRRSALIPTSAGITTVEPLTLEAQVRTRGRSRSLFDDPFFGGGLFARRVPVVVGSAPLPLEVLPLPGSAPDTFTGLVGRLAVSTSVDRDEARTNEALTFRLEVSGTGHLRTLTDPPLVFPPELEVYPPETSERIEPAADGLLAVKTFEYVLVPREPGAITIPPVELDYFDVDREAYAVAASAPIELRIGGDAVSGPAGRAVPRIGRDLERADVRFIRTASPAFRRGDAALVRSAVFWVVLVLPLVALTGAVAVRRHRDRLQRDVAYARRRRAARAAARRLAEAEALPADADHQAFHALTARALQGFLGDALNIAEAGMIQAEVRQALVARGVPDEVVDDYFACLAECDRYRFAPAGPGVGPDRPAGAARGQMLARARGVLESMQRVVQ